MLAPTNAETVTMQIRNIVSTTCNRPSGVILALAFVSVAASACTSDRDPAAATAPVRASGAPSSMSSPSASKIVNVSDDTTA